MAKSDKATIIRRVHEVVRLIPSGAEFADIRQYASAQGWGVSQRQLRRYLETAYRRLASVTKRDRRQLLGRHLMQRRALYARAIKNNDIRTALQVLRDEAELEALYPPTKIAPTTPDGRHSYLGPEPSPLSRRQRVVRLLSADAREDRPELRLLAHATPQCLYQLPDTTFPVMMLQLMALVHVSEQLEQAAMFVNSLFCATAFDDPNGTWDNVGRVSAYVFRIGREGWRLFAEELGVDGEQLVRDNYQGQMLELYSQKICDLAPSADELAVAMSNMGHATEQLRTAESQCKSWHRMLKNVLRD